MGWFDLIDLFNLFDSIVLIDLMDLIDLIDLIDFFDLFDLIVLIVLIVLIDLIDLIGLICLFGSLIDWLFDGLFVWMIDWLIDWLVGWLVDWLVGWLIGWLVGWLTGWLVCWLIDWLIWLFWLIGFGLIDWIGWIDWIYLIGLKRFDWFVCLIGWLVRWFDWYYLLSGDHEPSAAWNESQRLFPAGRNGLGQRSWRSDLADFDGFSQSNCVGFLCTSLNMSMCHNVSKLGRLNGSKWGIRRIPWTLYVSLFETRTLYFVFPECVARVPVSLWGSGGWGCVRSTLRLCSQPETSATVRNHS